MARTKQVVREVFDRSGRPVHNAHLHHNINQVNRRPLGLFDQARRMPLPILNPVIRSRNSPARRSPARRSPPRVRAIQVDLRTPTPPRRNLPRNIPFINDLSHLLNPLQRIPSPPRRLPYAPIVISSSSSSSRSPSRNPHFTFSSSSRSPSRSPSRSFHTGYTRSSSYDSDRAVALYGRSRPRFYSISSSSSRSPPRNRFRRNSSSRSFSLSASRSPSRSRSPRSPYTMSSEY